MKKLFFVIVCLCFCSCMTPFEACVQEQRDQNAGLVYEDQIWQCANIVFEHDSLKLQQQAMLLNERWHNFEKCLDRKHDYPDTRETLTDQQVCDCATSFLYNGDAQEICADPLYYTQRRDGGKYLLKPVIGLKGRYRFRVLIDNQAPVYPALPKL